MSSRASAVIVNFNARDHLLECLRSLRADGVEQIVVVDNESRDGSAAAVARADPGVVFFSTGANLGFGTAANRGVIATTSDYVMILNPDAVVEPGTTKTLADVLDTEPEVGIVGPRVENRDGTLYPSARRFPDLTTAIGHAFLGFLHPENRFTRNYKMLDQDRSQAAPVDWVSGTCMLARRSAFDQVGGFDEAYFMYVEDVDLCWRLGQAGWRILHEPRGRVVHTIGASSELAPYRMIAAHHRSLYRFAAKTAVGWRRRLLPLVGLGLAARTVLAWLQRAYRGRPHAAD